MSVDPRPLSLSVLAETFDDLSDTYVSLAAKPGNFGTTVHNAAFRHYNLPYRYLALTSTDIEADIALLKSLRVPGAAITMPHKAAVIPFLDDCTETAAAIGSVNTVTNHGGKLVGHNTDYYGARLAAKEIRGGDKTVILGTGAMARTYRYAIAQSEMIGRNEIGMLIADATVVINATPMGMPGVPPYPGILNAFPACRLYIESVVNQTETQADAAERGIEVMGGQIISFQQAFEQFRLFTAMAAPQAIMRESILVNE
jgi:shikimate dehydrogenase